MPEFGLCLPLDSQLTGFAAKAERLGYEFVSTGEHLAFHGESTNGFISLSMAAAATSSIGLVTSISLVPLYPPALLAKLAATLDHLSVGRFHLGVGIGGEFPPEFEAVGVPVAERGARTDEALEVVGKLLTGDAVTFDGRFSSFRDVRLAPVPARPLPVWVSGRKEPAMRRAAKYGDVWMPYMYSPEQVTNSRARITELSEAELGRPWQGRTAVYMFATVHPDRERAREVITERVGGKYQQDFDRIADRYLLFGAASDCRNRLEEYLAAGVDTVLLNLQCPRDELDEMTDVVTEEIVRPLRGAGS
ncbi:MAG: LLM class flavin-dependent oxidoreductase [Streptosporangiales bacterium]|nr:LLM class flavin-dependent oxidoreductase [Streptosporangiales bacterium]